MRADVSAAFMNRIRYIRKYGYRMRGTGFDREDLPCLFERFYRGKHAGEGGIGIGLALAKELIMRQNGTIRAGNRAEGGAFFEIR